MNVTDIFSDLAFDSIPATRIAEYVARRGANVVCAYQQALPAGASALVCIVVSKVEDDVKQMAAAAQKVAAQMEGRRAAAQDKRERREGMHWTESFKDVTWPLDKSGVLAAARRNGAPRALFKTLRRLPDDAAYSTLEDLRLALVEAQG